MKKLISLVIIAAMMCGSFQCITYAANDNYASADFGSNDKFDGIAKVVLEDGKDAKSTKTERGGKGGYEIPINNKGLYIDFEDDFLSKLDDGTEVKVDIEYYDQNSAHFMLLYDGLDGRTLADFIAMGNENQWKTFSYVIDDGYFGGQLDGHDMKISLQDKEMNSAPPSSVVIGGIKVTKYPAKNPVRAVISSSEVGNIFSPADENVLKIKYHNFSNKTENIKVAIDVVRDNEDVVWGTTDEFSIDSKADIDKEYKVDMTEFGLFHFRVTITNEEKTFNSVTKRAMSYANTDTSDIRNEEFLICSHYQWMGYREDGPELIRKANAGGVREGIEWNSLEQSKGKYDFDRWTYTKYFFNENQNNSMWVAGYNNPIYNSDNQVHQIPYTDEQREAYANQVAAIAQKYQGQLGKIEMYNEPVLFGNRMTNKISYAESAEDYAQLMEATYKKVKELGLDIKLGGMSHCGYQDPTQKEWYRQVMAAGGWKWMDAITGHPYPRNIPIDQDDEWLKMFTEHCKMAEEYGGSLDDYEIWLSEMGQCLPDVNGDEALQARNITRTYIYMNAIDMCDLFACYDISQDGINPTNREHMFGLTKHYLYTPTRVPLSANDAFIQIAQMNYMLAKSSPKNNVKADDKTTMYVFNSEKFNENVGVLWTQDENKKLVSFDLGCDSVTQYDRYGNATVVDGKNGVFTFVADNDPLYVKGNFKKCTPVDTQHVKLDSVDITAAGGDSVEIAFSSKYNVKAEIAKIATNLTVKNENWQQEGVLKLQLPLLTEGNTGLTLNFYEGDKLIQSTYVRINYDKRYSTAFNIELSDKGSLNVWDGKVSITNNSYYSNLNGYITVSSPEGFGTNKIPTGPIPPRKTANIKLEFSDLVKKGIYNFNYTIHADGNSDEYQNTADLTVAKKAVNPIKIDGVVEKGEWNNDTYMYSEEPFQIKNIKNWGGLKDLSAKTNIAWDDENIYMLVVARDNIHFNNYDSANIWQGDSVQFGLVFAPEMEVTLFGQKNLAFTELGMALSNNEVLVHRWAAEDSNKSAGPLENCECAITRNGNETIYEIKIPFEEILPSGYKFDPTRKIGFSMLVNDNDENGRRGWIEYASGIGENKNTTLFTFLQIVE